MTHLEHHLAADDLAPTPLATTSLGQAKAANATTTSRNFPAIAGVCTGSLFMLFLHDLVALG